MRLVLDTWNMAAVERALIVAALQHDAWEAASLLGITDKRFERLKQKHKIVWPPKRKRSTRAAKAKPATKAKPAAKAKPRKPARRPHGPRRGPWFQGRSRRGRIFGGPEPAPFFLATDRSYQ